MLSGKPTPVLPQPAPEIECWYGELEAAAEALQDHERLLSPQELQRAARFGTPTLRARYVVGRALLRRVLAHVLKSAPQDVPLRRGHRGRPEIDSPNGIDFNMTHTRGIAVVALSATVRVGVDIEHGDRDVNVAAVARKFMTAAERDTLARLSDDERRHALLRLWTCKEAMSKATGDGLSAPFRAIGIDVHRLLHLAGDGNYAPGAWRLHRVAIAEPYLATVAAWSPRPAMPLEHRVEPTR